jgi:hypothetical protein
MRRAAILVGEDVSAPVVGGAVELALSILNRLPFSECGNCGTVDGDCLVGMDRLAAGLVPRMRPDDHSVVMHRDLASVEID